MASHYLACCFCGRQDFVSQRGLTQHQRQSSRCSALSFAQHGSNKRGRAAHDCMPLAPVFLVNRRQNNVRTAEYVAQLAQENAPLAANIPRNWREPGSAQPSNAANTEASPTQFARFDGYESDDRSENSLAIPRSPAKTEQPNTELLSSFTEHVSKQEREVLQLSRFEKEAVSLLLLLRRTKASLGAYEQLMLWHLRNSGRLLPHEHLTDFSGYITRKAMINKLCFRCNINPSSHASAINVTLPHSNAQAQIVVNNVQQAMVSLLTDPRIADQDCLFFGEDPLQAPPEDLNYIGDLNTGKAYRDAHDVLITDPSRQILLPVIFYIDGANTGHFADLPITALKFSLGIFTRKARDKDYFWRTLGYVPAIGKHKSPM